MSTSIWTAGAGLLLGSPVLDFILPWEKPGTQAEIDREKDTKSKQLGIVEQRTQTLDHESLEQAISDLKSLLDHEADRRSSVDSRLATIVGLASIAGTIAVGIIIAQLGGALKIPDAHTRWILSAASLYLVLQLCDAVYWAVRGQSRRNYDEGTATDCIPGPSVAPEVELRHRISSLVRRLHFNQESVNEKVSAMAVAHRAAQNFAGGLLVLSIAAVVMASRGPGDPALLDTLRNDSELRQLLRGPAGPQGPAGPMGPQGEKGDRGPPVACPHGGRSNHSASQITQCHPG